MVEKNTSLFSSNTIALRSVLMVNTVTLHSAVKFLPSLSFATVVAVMTASPFSTAVTTPSSFTVATVSSEDVHITLSSSNVRGPTFAVIVSLEPLISPSSVLESSMLSQISVSSIPLIFTRYSAKFPA